MACRSARGLMGGLGPPFAQPTPGTTASMPIKPEITEGLSHGAIMLLAGFVTLVPPLLVLLMTILLGVD